LLKKHFILIKIKCFLYILTIHSKKFMITIIQWQDYWKLLSLLQAFKDSAEWVLLSSFCDDSNLHISVFKQLVSTQVKSLNQSFNDKIMIYRKIILYLNIFHNIFTMFKYDSTYAFVVEELSSGYPRRMVWFFSSEKSKFSKMKGSHFLWVCRLTYKRDLE